MAETTVTFLTYDPTTQVYTPELRVFNLEITSEAQSTYTAYMNLLQLYISQITEGSATAEENMPKIADLLANLDTWTKAMYVSSGSQIDQTTSSSTVTIEDPTTSGGTLALNQLGTMDRYMAADVDKLIRTFRAAGYDPITKNFVTSDTSFSSIANKLFVTDTSLYDVSGTLSDALNVASQCRISTDVWTQSQSIQQLLMVDYISRGNELLYDEMSQLKDAIDINQNALSYLNSLQDLMNQKDPQHFVMALQYLSGAVGGDVASTYSDFEKATFNQELQNVAKFSDSEIETYLKSLLGLDPTATPTSSETTGSALGAFQTLGDSAMDPSLETYLSSQGITATMASLLPVLADNTTYNTKMSTFISTYNLSSSDAELIWRTFLINQAGLSALPSSVDLTADATLTAFDSFLTSLGAQTPTSTTLPTLLQSSFDTMIQEKFTSLLSTGTYPPELKSWSAARTIIDNGFSYYNLSDAQKLLVMQAFLIKQGQALSVSPDAIDMTTQSNLNALTTFVNQVASLLNPQTVLTNALMTDAGISDVSDFDSLYPAALSSWGGIMSMITLFLPETTWHAETDEDKLNLLRAFILRQAKSTGQDPEDIDMTLNTNKNAFRIYIQSFTDVSSQSDYYYQILSSLSGGLSDFPAYSDLNDLYPPSLDLSQWSSVPFDTIFASFTPFSLSDTEKLNIVRVFLAGQNQASPESVDLTDPTVQSNLQSYVESLCTYGGYGTTYPMDLATLKTTLTSQLGNYQTTLTNLLAEQYPADLKDWSLAKIVVEEDFSLFTPSDDQKLNIVKAFLVKEGNSLGVSPDSIDMTSTANLNLLASYVTELSSGTVNFQSLLEGFIGSSLTGAYPTNIEPWDKAEEVVKATFTAFTPSDSDVLKIIQSFLTEQASTQGTTPDAIDISQTSTLSALESYVHQLSTNSTMISASYLTTVPSFSLDLYQPLVDEYFPDLSDTDKLNLWKGFLIAKGYTDNSSVTLTDSTVRADFEIYLEDIKGAAGSASGEDLVNQIYEYLYTKDQDSTETLYLSRFATYLANTSMTCPSGVSSILNSTDLFPTDSGYSTTDLTNVWKCYAAYTGSTDFNIFTDTEVVTEFATKIKALVDSYKGADLVNKLKEALGCITGFTSIESLTTLQQTVENLASMNIGYPSSTEVKNYIDNQMNQYCGTIISGEEDRLNIWRAFMISNGNIDPTSYTTVSSVGDIRTFLDNFITTVYSLPLPTASRTGAALTDFLETYVCYPPDVVENPLYDPTSPFQEAYIAIKALFPDANYTSEDRRNIWRACCIIDGGIARDNVPFASTVCSDIKTWIERAGEHPTGQALVTALEAYIYQAKSSSTAKDLSDMSAVTSIVGSTTFDYGALIDQTITTQTLTSAQKLRVWDAFLAANAGTSSSEAFIDVTSQTTIDKFKTYLAAIAPSDLGSALDTRMQRIITNLSYLVDQVSGSVSDATTSPLVQALTAVKNDFSGLVSGNLPITKWVQDYESGQIGTYQKHLNDAITASQSLNDTEREELQNVMFVYEEFYKSATAMLSSLTQLIEKIATSISR